MSKLRKVRTGLNLLIVILLTLLGRHFYDGWRSHGLAEEIVSSCGLPELPDGMKVLSASRDGTNVTLSVTGPDQEFIEWLEKVDEWKEGRPIEVLNFSIRESEKSPRMDFSAELRD